MREVDYLVSLLDRSEQWELGLSEEKSICRDWEIEFINFPIKDVNVPKNERQFIELVRLLAQQIQNDKKVVIHCRMGIGRASMLAAGILICLGCKAKDSFEIIEQYRKLKVPDTEEQRQWIISMENQLRNQ